MSLSGDLQQQIDEEKLRYKEFLERAKYYEELAARDAARYQKLVTRYVWLGRGFIYGTLLLWVAILGAVIALSIMAGDIVNRAEFYAAIILLPLIYVTLRALVAISKEPEGITLSRKDAPTLWSEVDRIAHACGAPVTHKIILDSDFNASAAQRTAVLTPWRVKNYLVLGIPLLLATKREEVLSVVAHEYGHFSGNHGKFTGKIYRVDRVFAELRNYFVEKGSFLAGFYRNFYDWFLPRFRAMTLAMSRRQEYDADAMAVRIMGVRPTSDFLLKLGFLATVNDEKRSEFERLVVELAAPSPEELVRIMEGLADPLPPAKLGQRIEQELNLLTEAWDTHPGLRDRLDAIGVSNIDPQAEGLRLSLINEETAARALLGDKYREVVLRWAKYVCSEFEPYWKRRRELHAQGAMRLQELNSMTCPLTVEEAIERADIMSKTVSKEESCAEYRRLLTVYPSNSQLMMRAGYLLIILDDAEGVPILTEAARMLPENAPELLAAIEAFHLRRGASEEAARLRDEQFGRRALRNALDEEQSTLHLKMPFVPAELTFAEREKLVRQLKEMSAITEAYVVGLRSAVLEGKVMNHLLVFRKQVIEVENDQTVGLRAVSELDFPNLRSWAPGLLSKWRPVLSKIDNARVK